MYTGWKLLDRIGIVTKNRGVNKWGYFVDPDNADQVTTAKQWAGIRHDGEMTEDEYYVTENRDFRITIVGSAGGTSQGGKLSWWTVKITKDGNELFTAINADQLCSLIKQSTFINGICSDTVSYATCNGSNAFLSKACEEYKQAVQDMQRKSEVKSRKKTSKHKIGKVYSTLTESDAYIWDYYQCYQVVCNDWWRRDPTIKIEKIQPIKLKHMEPVDPGDVASKKFLDARCFAWMYGKEKLPARFENNNFDFTYDLTSEMLTNLEQRAKEIVMRQPVNVSGLKVLVKSFDPNYAFDTNTRKWLTDNNVALIE